MRTIVFAVVAIIVGMMMIATVGCTSKGGDEDTTAVDSLSADSISGDVSEIDSIIAAAPMPKQADELFDDFVFHFAADPKVQKKRTAFPLTITSEGRTETLKRDEWTMNHFFMHQEFYSIIAGNERGLRAAADTSVSHVTIERLGFRDGIVRQYEFNRVDGLWQMQQIKDVTLAEHNDASFLQFLYKFTTDDSYQYQSLSESIAYTGPSSDDDETIVRRTVRRDDWENTIHALPDNYEECVAGEGIYDIIYGGGQKSSDTRVVSFRGISNGNELKYTFKRKGTGWTLIKYEM